MTFRDNRKCRQLISLILILYTNKGVCQFVCPTVAELYSTVLLECTFVSPTDIHYFTPSGVTATTCIPERTSCINDRSNRFNGTVVNSTQAILEIINAQLSDEGEWICRDVKNSVEQNCSVVLTKTPSCSITSDRDIHEIDLGDEITLSVAVEDSYCTLIAGFQLKTGEETMELVNNDSGIFKSTFNLSETHFGAVGLLYTCNNVTKEITCRNIERLTQEMFECSITSDPEADRLTVGEEVSITVNIEDYFCSKVRAAFMLQTGDRTVKLGETARSDHSIGLSVTFKVTEEHLGMVKVIFICNNVSRSFNCSGITAFEKETQTTGPTSPAYIDTESPDVPSHNVAVIGGAAGAGGAVAVAGIIIVVIVVKRRRNSSKTSKEKSNHAEMTENVNGRSKSITVSAPGGYEEIGSINSSFANNGFVKESAGSSNGVELYPNLGYMSSDEIKLESTESRNPRQPENQPNFRPENIYTQVNTKPKLTT